MADLNDLTTNVNIWDDSKSKAVSVVTDGAVNRLSVDAREQPATNYQLKSSIETTGDSVTTTDTSLYSFSGSGVIDFIAVNDATSSAFEVILKIDGTERFRVTMSELGSTLGLTDANFDMVAQTANKQFRYHPTAIGFSTSFEVLARATTGTRTLYHMVLFREQVLT